MTDSDQPMKWWSRSSSELPTPNISLKLSCSVSLSPLALPGLPLLCSASACQSSPHSFGLHVGPLGYQFLIPDRENRNNWFIATPDGACPKSASDCLQNQGIIKVIVQVNLSSFSYFLCTEQEFYNYFCQVLTLSSSTASLHFNDSNACKKCQLITKLNKI